MVPAPTAVFAPGSAQMNYTAVNSGARRTVVDKKCTASSRTSLCRRLCRLNYLFLRVLAPAQSLFPLWQESLRDHSVNSTSMISPCHL